MNDYRILFPKVWACFLTLPSIFSFGQAPTFHTQEFYDKVDSIVNQKMIHYDIPGLAIGLVKNGSILYSKGYGSRKTGSNLPVSGRTVFHTASISKLFTAMAIMHLVKENKLDLNDKLVEMLPDLHFRDARVKKITIEQLLNHTSGLPDINNYHWKNNHQSKHSLRDFMLGLNLKVVADPASKYKYSNLGYDILGYVIESVSEVPFEAYVQEHILTPSGMNDSDFRYFNIPDSLKTAPHSKRGKKVYIRKTYPYTREHAPSSTLNASSQDLAKWMIFFMKKVASSPTYASMLASSFEAYPYIGLGFQLFDFETHQAVGHFGGDRGFRSFLMMIPEQKIGLVVLGNCDYEEDYRQEILRPIAKLMLADDERF